jgi:putrescine aminotransferase
MNLVREICDRHGILMIADEVVTGFGRTGAWSGSRLWGVKPDMMTMAKAITSGYFPLGATLIGEAVADAFEADTTTFGSIGHGYTYSGHPVGCAAGIAALAETRRLKLDENAAARGKDLAQALAALKAKHALVGDVRGKGLMAALELVADRDSKKPADKKTMAKVAGAAYEAGVMLRVSGNNLILSPPLILTSLDVKAIADGIDAGLSAAG